MYETMTVICIGIGLSAACGFRVFIPMLAMGIVGRTDWLTLSDGFEWMSSTPALTVFAVATIVEIGAYYFPWLDNLLDSISIPAAVVAGVVTTAACVGDIDPMMKWSLATIAGGGSAGTIKVGTAGLRLGSSFLTAGIANPIVATLEWIASIFMSILAILLPFVAAVLSLFCVVVLFRYGLRFVKWRMRSNEGRMATKTPQ